MFINILFHNVIYYIKDYIREYNDLIKLLINIFLK